MNTKKSTRFYNDRRVRAVWSDEENKWYFSATDIVRAINDEPDYIKAGNYWRWLKKKLASAGIQLVSATHEFKFEAPDGKQLKEEQRAEEARENARRGAFRFSQAGIAPGERVVFIEDESIQPIVVDDRHIEYNGQTTSLSALAQQLKGFHHPVQGTLWFTYNGVKLTELRERMEKKQ